MSKSKAANNLWDRWPGETPKPWQAFTIYRDMGLDRSGAKVGDKLGKSSTLIERWSSRYRWVARVELFDAFVDKSNQASVMELAKRDYEIANAVELKLLNRAMGYSHQETTQERISDTGQKARHKTGEAITLTALDWAEAQKYFTKRCAYCGSPDKLTKDHVVPLKVGGGLTKQNTIPCCGKCNSSKLDIEMRAWYFNQKFFTQTRFARINRYLEKVSKIDPVKHSLTITKVVTKEEPPHPQTGMYWLQHRRPDRWPKQALEVDVDVTGEIAIEEKVTIEQLITILNLNDMPIEKLRLLAWGQG